jgi:hypothetical protein
MQELVPVLQTLIQEIKTTNYLLQSMMSGATTVELDLPTSDPTDVKTGATF